MPGTMPLDQERHALRSEHHRQSLGVGVGVTVGCPVVTWLWHTMPPQHAGDGVVLPTRGSIHHHVLPTTLWLRSKARKLRLLTT